MGESGGEASLALAGGGQFAGRERAMALPEGKTHTDPQTYFITLIILEDTENFAGEFRSEFVILKDTN